MSSGRYGTIAPSNIAVNDIEILYTFQEKRESEPTTISTLNPLDVLTTMVEPLTQSEVLAGLYKMRLSKDIFNKIGIYTLLIRPKRVKTTITDCGVLTSLPDVKGIVLNGSDQNLIQNISTLTTSNGLVGYRVEYVDNATGSIIKNFFTIITSSNKAEAVNQNQSNTTSKSITYRFSDSGSLIYLTLTPSSASQVLPNRKPFVGSAGQTVYISNTFFDPIMLEVNLTKYDIESVIKYVAGNRTENFTNGKVTFFNDDNSIYDQKIDYTIKDEFNKPLYHVIDSTDIIDTNEDFEDIKSGINNV